jgi:G3E family GTPase
VTKTDIAAPADVAALRRQLSRINPSASLIDAAAELADPASLLTQDSNDPRTKSAEVQRWFAAAPEADEPHAHPGDVNRHDAAIAAFCLIFDRPLDWTMFGVWLSMLLSDRGEDVLRVKGLLNVLGSPGPVVIHGVQHIVHRPVHLDAWPDADRRSRIVFITRSIARERVARSFAAFQRLTDRGYAA